MGWTSSLKFETLLLECIKRISLCVLEFEHALLVRTCDVFETTYPVSLVSMVFQVGSVGSFFFTLLVIS